MPDPQFQALDVGVGPIFIDGKEYQLVEVEQVCESCYDNDIESLQDWGRAPDVIYKLIEDSTMCPRCIANAADLNITVEEYLGKS
jgi:rubredoxin